MSASDAPRRIATVADAALKLASGTTTGRIVLARLARQLDLSLLPAAGRERIQRILGDQGSHVLPALDSRELHQTLAGAWDADPREKLDELDPEPAAVTPTAQVHRAVLGGAPVAVKVLRPGLGARFRQDFAVLEALISPLTLAFPQLDAAALLSELRERTLDEFDLEHEASAQRRVHRALRRHPLLRVPAPISGLSTEQVMVSHWATGTPLLQAPAPDQAAARLALFVIGGAREGIVHADPDPEDVLVGEDGSLTLLDFGAVKAVSPQRATLVLEAVDAYAAGDAGRFSCAVSSLGVLSEGHGAAAMELTRHALADLGDATPARLDVDALLAAGERLTDRRDEVLELVLAGQLPPEDLWPGRAVVQLFATIARLGATAPWREIVIRALRDGWSAELPA